MTQPACEISDSTCHGDTHQPGDHDLWFCEHHSTHIALCSCYTPFKEPARDHVSGAVVQYDYTNQAWLRDGVYQKCGHLECEYVEGYERQCYGSKHEGERGLECVACGEWTIIEQSESECEDTFYCGCSDS